MIKTPICDLLGIEYPIFQGGMAWISDGKLAAAVSNGGGLGIISAMNANAEYLKKQIDLARSLTDKPFGVNIMLMSPFAEEVAQLVAQEKVAVVTTGAGNPSRYMPMWLEAGIKVIPVVDVYKRQPHQRGGQPEPVILPQVHQGGEGCLVVPGGIGVDPLHQKAGGIQGDVLGDGRQLAGHGDFQQPVAVYVLGGEHRRRGPGKGVLVALRVHPRGGVEQQAVLQGEHLGGHAAVGLGAVHHHGGEVPAQLLSLIHI